MTLEQIKEKVRESYYMEDDSLIDVALACIIANRLQLGDPVWLVIVGASSGGKSQILRPLAMTDEKYIHKIDDITENTFLSGGVAKGGKDVSLLTRMGSEAMISISDLTVLFSRNAESRNAILSQFRMLYDGEMTKSVGNKEKSLHWKGYMGVIAGSTPSIYSILEEVSDMGERFMYYRMKPYDERKATRVALSRKLCGHSLDEMLSELYGDYIKGIVKNNRDNTDVELLPDQVERIIDIASLAEKIRTTNKLDRFTKEIERIPTPAMPMRTALQLMNISKALRLMRGRDLDDFDMDIIFWLGLSLANEEKREVLRILDSSNTSSMTSQAIADVIGLDTKVVKVVLQNLASTKVVIRSGESNSLHWSIDSRYKNWFSREEVKYKEREQTHEEIEGSDETF